MKNMLTVLFKELRELSRDRRTLMLALLFSPLLGPILMIGMQQMGESKAKSEMEKPLAVAIVGAERAPNLVAWLAGQGIARKQVADPDAAIRAQNEDVYIRIDDKFDEHWAKGEPALVEVVSDSTRQDAAIPVARVQSALKLYGQQVGALRLLARGINPGVASPLAVADKDLSLPEARKSLATFFIPYLLLISGFLGGAALVIDATAGERERQSLEPLLATPAPRSAIVSGKILAACLLGMASLFLSLLAFKVGGQLSEGMGRQLSLSAFAILELLLIISPMVALGNALLTFIASGAKSVKEAQSFLSVLMLVPMLPSILLLIHPVKNQLWMFAVPFLSQNQAIVKVVRGEAIAPMEWLVYLGAGFGVAALLWYAAVRRYRQEKLAISA
ncbi:ABC transporter permease [Pseudoluteimonas lycopersici]|jgi:sodium transport system permease protein|uniref:ABC transporter permease n=1 Tax=Pseudoluteimonas lycopersici TaxID=1324796 RepID=A0A516V6C9_9GAMM|nr:ABC transporter permease [Lysobacter lycopersici]QDQ74068.1 ABC transporter permease [Lysobacter lycopersici]